jgi:3-methyl-2-oxobutanoate hydroxymethyltransferase
MRRQGKKISMVTAYDYPSAKHAENAEFDMVLVGDSLGMVVLGYENTQPVTMEDMIHHCKAARRGAPTRFIVGDMPFGSYESGPDEALRNAYRFVKEAAVDAVKLEGGGQRVESVRKLATSGIAVMGHIGLTPQGISVLGGFRAQGRTAVKARSIVDDALALQEAGAFALVVECVPPIVAKAVTEAVKIPVIGIGAGPHTTGQVLVYHDLLGIDHHPHFEKHVPSFCKRYLTMGGEIHRALKQYRDDVHSGAFPTAEYSPYKMSEEETLRFEKLMEHDKVKRAKEAEEMAKKLREQDEYETIKLY